MPTIAEVRQKFPQYSDLSDGQLASALHAKFYPDMPEDQFMAKIGMPTAPKSRPGSHPDFEESQKLIAKDEQSGMLGGVTSALGGFLEGVPILGPALVGGAKRGAAGIISAVDPNATYQEVLDFNNKTYDAAKEAHPNINTGAQITGGVVSTLPLAATATGARMLGITGENLATRAGTAAVTNSALSAADTAARGGNASEIAGSAGIGAILGGGIPVLGSAISTAGKPVFDAVKARIAPKAFASQKIVERMANDGISVDQAANKMARGGLSLADAGGQGTRNLLKTTTNIPGPAQQAVKSKLTLQAMGQGDRIKKVIGDTLADPEGFLTAKDDIAAEAQRLAAPLYKQARATPVHYSQTLEGILETPAGKAALAKAEQLAANEQVPFQQLFVNVAPNGASATVKRVPDARGWDYIKRAMDDMIDGQTDAITKKVSNEGRILIGLKNKMLSEVDSVNPAYAAARRVWGGQKQLDDALEFGKKAMTMPPEAVERHIASIGAADHKALQVGAAEWARSVLDKGGFTQNAVIKLFGNRQQVRIWKAIFGDEQKFKTFRQAMFAEAKKRETYNVVGGNSSTVKQAADLADAGGLSEMFQTGKTMATQGPIAAALQFASSRLKMLGGFTPKVADEIAKQLMARSPQEVLQIKTALQQIEASNISALAKRQQVQALITSVGARSSAMMAQ